MNNIDFDIIPAIDILDGKCVRLTQGQYDLVEEFSSNPKEIIKKWVDLGAKRLHIIDLNGAKEGYPYNFKVISEIMKTTTVVIQVGGGIRTLESMKNYLDEGASYLILGTKIFKDSTFLNTVIESFTNEVILGLDFKNDKVALSGWQETLDISLDKLKTSNLSKIKQTIVTDTSKDGTLSGPNIKLVENISKLFNSKIIVSGGVSSVSDISKILNLKANGYSNITGVILGKSLYKGTIDLTSALELVRNELNNQVT